MYQLSFNFRTAAITKCTSAISNSKLFHFRLKESASRKRTLKFPSKNIDHAFS